ncbi:serine/threonine-protein phosphatase 6 regulatory subunit 2 isoform X4 [Camelus ferus]|uniref:Serine/threonine-protein phosphatase 6 regulatory subunit 2 isoform X4 n=1 Tax=Camelus ferus TaxID=419612 RepID=A0A8B8U2Q8_CAMFR|nr:serine/threonine-protein phosphatase 6 regulatory subunit 2 isoform X4 [Camelus ferus]
MSPWGAVVSGREGALHRYSSWTLHPRLALTVPVSTGISSSSSLFPFPGPSGAVCPVLLAPPEARDLPPPLPAFQVHLRLEQCREGDRQTRVFRQPQGTERLPPVRTVHPVKALPVGEMPRYPNMACELLTCDVPQINDRLGGDEALLNLLYSFLDREPPLNPLLASFFSKTIGNLIARKTEQVIVFLKKKDKFISLVLKHIGTSALMDLLLRLVSCVEPAGLRQEVLHWLSEEQVIQRLVELVHPSQDEDWLVPACTHPQGGSSGGDPLWQKRAGWLRCHCGECERQSNASQTLCDIIRLGREQGSQLHEAPEPDPLLTALESQDCVEQLLKNMFDGDHTELCLVSGTQVLLALLETRRAGTEGLVDACSQGLDRPCTVSSGVLHGIEPRLKDFHQLLLSPPKKKAILTTIGVLEEPLGSARLHSARLVAALLHTNTPSINQELCRLNTMGLLLDLFFKYTWNNFLHLQVELCIAAILSHAAWKDRAEASGPEGRLEPPPLSGDPETPQPAASCPENTMVTHLFQKCCLVQRILEAWEANDHTQAAGGMRRGNMGHLTRIANAVVQNLERGPMQTPVSEVIQGLPEDCRGRWESFVEETLTEANRRNAVDLAFSEYQVQQMTATFVDQFGFSDEEFAEQDDSVNAPFDRIADISFSVDADEDSPGAALFEACCSDHIQPFDEEDDLWEDEEPHHAARVTRARFGGPRASESCSKDGLERGVQVGEGSLGADGDAVRAGTSWAVAPTEGPCAEGGSKGATWPVFDEPVNSVASVPGVAVDVGSSVWAVSAPSTSAPEEKGWAKFTDFQPFCCAESGPRCSSPVDMGPSDAQGSLNQGPERTLGPAVPSAWNVYVTRKAPLVASSSHEDEQKVAGALEAVSVGPGHEAPQLPVSVPRAGCATSTPPDPAPPAPAEVTSPSGVAVLPRAAVAATTVLDDSGPTPATLAASPVLSLAVTTAPASPALSTVATLGTVTRDRQTDVPPPAGAASNGPV